MDLHTMNSNFVCFTTWNSGLIYLPHEISQLKINQAKTVCCPLSHCMRWLLGISTSNKSLNTEQALENIQLGCILSYLNTGKIEKRLNFLYLKLINYYTLCSNLLYILNTCLVIRLRILMCINKGFGALNRLSDKHST